MTLLHPASTGSPISVWFVDDVPVRLLSGSARFRVLDEPKCADINGERYWRVRAQDDEGMTAMFDLKQDGGGWLLAGVDEDLRRTGSR